DKNTARNGCPILLLIKDSRAPFEGSLIRCVNLDVPCELQQTGIDGIFEIDGPGGRRARLLKGGCDRRGNNVVAMVVGEFLGAAPGFVVELESGVTVALNVVALLIAAAAFALDAPRRIRFGLAEHGSIHVLEYAL